MGYVNGVSMIATYVRCEFARRGVSRALVQGASEAKGLAKVLAPPQQREARLVRRDHRRSRPFPDSLARPRLSQRGQPAYPASYRSFSLGF